MILKYIIDYKASFFALVFLTISSLYAQIIELIVQTNLPSKKIGYFFITPYKINFIKKKSLTELNEQYIINTLGEVVFFRKTIFGSDFKLHANNLMSYWHGNKFYLLNTTFQIVDSVGCVNGVETDPHDIKILRNGHYLLCGKESEIIDLSNIKVFTNLHLAGSKKAIVKYDVVQELDEKKNLVYEWRAKPFFDIKKINPVYFSDTSNLDVTHFNSIDMDQQGNILVSFRRFDEIIKINKKSNTIVWRMGGPYNQIKVLNDNIPFLGQHDAQFTGKNTITLFDNGYSSDSLQHNVRALEYKINDKEKTAVLIWKYSNKHHIVSSATGNFKKNKDGTKLINYGKTNKEAINIMYELLNDKNEIIQSVSFKDTLGTYRTYYYKKLPIKLHPETIVIIKKEDSFILKVKNKFNHYLWNTGETTPEITVKSLQKNYVFISNDGINFTRSKSIK